MLIKVDMPLNKETLFIKQCATEINPEGALTKTRLMSNNVDNKTVIRKFLATVSVEDQDQDRLTHRQGPIRRNHSGPEWTCGQRQ